MITQALYALQHRIRLHAAGMLFALRHGSPAAPARGSAVGEPGKLALVITGLLGDTVMCTPVIREARRIWPAARITVIGMRHNCELLSGCPEIDGLHLVVADPFSLRRRAENRSFREWLVHENFDVAIVLLGDQFAMELARAGIPVRVGVQGHPLSKCLSHAYDCGTPNTWGPAEKLNSLRVLGCAVREVPATLWIDDAARRDASESLQRLGIAPNETYAAIHPFGRAPARRWPASRWGSLAPLVRERFRMKLLLTGLTEAPFDMAPETWLVDGRSEIGMHELPAVLERAALVISTDSGPFHVAGALGTPLVGLFRSVYSEHSVRYPHAEILKGVDPRCVGRCTWKRCRTLPCRQMSAITPADVLHAMERALAKAK
ncbi:MAG TPA: glycosyltransferase family 9 protein [Acidobacteriota bacterium]|nr:glycosyltransferase family 9 protein [Acidobacteriota bacterium]